MGWGKGLYDLVKIRVQQPGCGYYVRWWYNGWHYWFFRPGRITVRTTGEEYRTHGHRRLAMCSGQLDRQQAEAIRTIMNATEYSMLTDGGWRTIGIEPGSVRIYDNQLAGAELEMVAIVGSRSLSYSSGYSPADYTVTITYPLLDIDGNEYHTVNIGTQQWIVENLRVTHYADGTPIPNLTANADWAADLTGAYCWYNNDIINKDDYGALYNWYAYSNPLGIVNFLRNGVKEEGWRLPTITDLNYLQAQYGGLWLAGGPLKEAGNAHWDAPNTGATNASKFSARGAGSRDFGGNYHTLRVASEFWSIEDTPTAAFSWYMAYDSTIFSIGGASFDKNFGFSIRVVRDI